MASDEILAVVDKYKAGELSAVDAAEMLYDSADTDNAYNEVMTKILRDFHAASPYLLRHYAVCVGGIAGASEMDKEKSSRAIEAALEDWNFKRKVEAACAALIQPLIDDPTMPWGCEQQEDDAS